MLLKFIGWFEKSKLVDADYPLVVGEMYEVAEILEHLGHIMARKPGEKHWPKPGDPGFCWDAEYFEPSDEPLPIISCGYSYSDYLSDYFGVFVDDPEDVAKARSYDELLDALVDLDDLPEDGEDYGDWYSRVGREYPLLLAECTYDLEQHLIGVPAVTIRDDVFLKDDEFRIPCATFAYSTQEMVEQNVLKSDAEQRITELLRASAIDEYPARILGAEQWWSYGQSPRLINPTGCHDWGHRSTGPVTGLCPQCGQPYR